MKKVAKFDVWFQKNIQNIFWDRDFIEMLSLAKSKNHGDVIDFKGEKLVVDTSSIAKSLILGIPAKIDNNDAVFMFKLPLYKKDCEDSVSLHGGICYIDHPEFKKEQAYSVSGYYDLNDNVLQVEKIYPISD